MVRSAFALTVFLAAFASLSAFAAALRSSDRICDDCLANVHVGDFDGDGLDDVLSVHWGEIRFNTDGALGAPVIVSGLGANDSVKHAGDYNGDGFADLIVEQVRGAHDQGPDRLLLGNGFGAFAAGPALPASYGSTGSPRPLDYDGDGKLDLVVMRLLRRMPVTLEGILGISFLRGNGDGTFTFDQQVELPASQCPRIGVADFNRDGRRDLVLSAGEPLLYFYMADANGRFGVAVERFTGVHTNDMHVADVNGDTFADVLFSDWNVGVNGLTVLFGDGFGRFPAVARRTPVNANDRLVVADLYPGGAHEIAYAGETGQVIVLSAVGNELKDVAKLAVRMDSVTIQSARVRENAAVELIAFGRLGHQKWSGTLLFAEGRVPDPVQVARIPVRRSRATGRGSKSTVVANESSYSAQVSGVCAPALLTWSFVREGEGIFLDGFTVAGTKSAQAAIVGGQLLVRLVVADGTHDDRRIWGALDYTPQRLRGTLRDINDTTSCGASGTLFVSARSAR